MTLYETLEALTEPSREVDARIAMLCEPDGEEGTYHRAPFISEISDKDCVHGQYWKCAISGRSLRTAPEYTADINAVIGLVEREVPGWNIQLWKFNAGPERRCRATLSRLPLTKGYADAGHALPAVALLMAFVKARGEG